MPFRFEDNSVLIKYNEIRNKIKVAGLKFQSKPVYDEKYIKTKVKTFNGVVNTIIWGDKIPKEGVHYSYIAAIIIDSVIRILSSILRKTQI